MTVLISTIDWCSMSLRTKYRAGLLAIVLPLMFIPVVIAIRAGVYDSWLDNPVNGFGMWGVFAIYLWTRPPRKEFVLVLAAASVLHILRWAIAGEASYPGSSVINIGVYFPFLCVPILAYRAWKGPHKATHRLSVGGVLLFSYMSVFLAYYISFAKIVCHYKFDYLLFAFDGSLGPHWNFWIGKIASAFHPLAITLETAYYSLGLFVSVLFAAHVNLPNNKIDILKLNIASPIIGFSLYFLYPAMGPRYAFPSFPELPGHVPSGPALLYGVPNAMPSLHMAAALTVFSLARPWRWLRWTTGVYLVVMFLAVLSTGEHFLVDTLVAIPYSLMMIAFVCRSDTPGRRYVLMAGSGMLAHTSPTCLTYPRMESPCAPSSFFATAPAATRQRVSRADDLPPPR